MNNVFFYPFFFACLLSFAIKTSKLQAQSFTRMMNLGNEAVQNKDIQRAIYFFKEASNLDPQSALPHVKLLSCAIRSEKVQVFIQAYQHLRRNQYKLNDQILCLCHLFDPVANIHLTFFNELYRQIIPKSNSPSCLGASYAKYLQKTNQLTNLSIYLDTIDWHSIQDEELLWFVAEHHRVTDINQSINVYKKLLTHTDYIDISLLRLSEIYYDKYKRYKQIPKRKESDRYLQLYLNRQPNKP